MLFALDVMQYYDIPRRRALVYRLGYKLGYLSCPLIFHGSRIHTSNTIKVLYFG